MPSSTARELKKAMASSELAGALSKPFPRVIDSQMVILPAMILYRSRALLKLPMDVLRCRPCHSGLADENKQYMNTSSKLKFCCQIVLDFSQLIRAVPLLHSTVCLRRRELAEADGAVFEALHEEWLH